MKTYKCPSCNGDGISTCHNPDHGFLSFIEGANESACPCCGHSSDHKVRRWRDGTWKNMTCEYCGGTGKCNEQEAELALYECNIDEPVEDYEIL